MDKFIMIDNALISEGHELQLNKDELYMFILLQMSKGFNDELYFTLSLLYEKSKIPFASGKQRSVQKMKESLLTLAEKGLITVCTEKSLEQLKPNDVIVAKVRELESRGFTMFSLEMYNYIDVLEHVYIYLATYRWFNSEDGAFTCSWERWGRILQCSKRHAIDLVNEAVEKRIIYKNTGDYNKDGKQNVNQYKTQHFSQKEKTLHTKKQDEAWVKNLIKSENEGKQEVKQSPLEKLKDLSTDLEHFEVGDLEDSYNRFSNFTDEQGKNVFPIVQDYVAMSELSKEQKNRPLTELEALVFNAGVKRMKVLEQNPKTKAILSDMQKKAEKSLKELREKQAKEKEQEIVTISRSGESEVEYMDTLFGDD